MGCGAYVDVQQTSTNQTKIISASPLFQSSIRKNKLKKSKHFGKKREGLEASLHGQSMYDLPLHLFYRVWICFSFTPYSFENLTYPLQQNSMMKQANI